MHIDAVVDRIETYSASISKPVTAVAFGETTLPDTPYCVVKQELGYFRITTHMNPGQGESLRKFVRKDLQNALEDQTLTGSDGEQFRLGVYPEDVPGEVRGDNDDGSISQERLFFAADRI